jgi:Na+/melibiose symporter-like transporter
MITKYQKMSRVASLIIIAVMVYFLWLASNLKHGKIYPMVVILTAIFLALITIYLSFQEESRQKKQALKLGKDTIEQVEVINLTIALAIVVPLVLLLLWKTLSFLICGFLTAFILMLYKKESAVKSLVISALMVLILQYIFVNQFMVPLPSPGWWNMFW